MGLSKATAFHETRRHLHHHLPHHPPAHIRQTLFPPLVKIRQRLVVHAHEAEDGGVDVVKVDFVFRGGEAEFVGAAVGHAAFDATACEPHAEAVGVVVAAGRALAFAEGHAAEFTAPHDESFVEHAALFEIGEEGGDGLVDFGAVLAVVLLDALVGVPRLFEVAAAGVELDEADAALDEPAGDEAVAAKLVGGLLADAVHVQGLGRFIGDVHGLRGFGLHAVRELVGFHPRRQFLGTGIALHVNFVELRQEVELSALGLAAQMLRAIEIEDGITHGTKQCPGVGGGHEAAGPVRLAADGATALVEHDDVAGQALVFATEAVGAPAPERRAANEGLARVHGHQGGAVGVAVGVAGVDDAEFIGVFAHVGEIVGNKEAALAAGTEFAEVGREETHLAAAGIDVIQVLGHGLARVLLQFGLIVKRVHLARRTIHHEKDAGLGPGLQQRRARREGILPRSRRAREEAFAREQPGQGNPGKARAHLPDKFAAGLATGEKSVIGHGIFLTKF